MELDKFGNEKLSVINNPFDKKGIIGIVVEYELAW
jgi:hypothetical protein